MDSALFIGQYKGNLWSFFDKFKFQQKRENFFTSYSRDFIDSVTLVDSASSSFSNNFCLIMCIIYSCRTVISLYFNQNGFYILKRSLLQLIHKRCKCMVCVYRLWKDKKTDLDVGTGYSKLVSIRSKFDSFHKIKIEENIQPKTKSISGNQNHKWD